MNWLSVEPLRRLCAQLEGKTSSVFIGWESGMEAGAAPAGSLLSKGTDQRNVFHVFTDAVVIPASKKSGGRYGLCAIGSLILRPTGRDVLVFEERARVIGTHTCNRAELHAILHSLLAALETIPNPVRATVIVHTDSEIAYRGIKHDQLKDTKLCAIRDSIRALHGGFRVVDYRREPRESLGIRRAETLARLELEEKLGKPLRRRGKKGGRRRHKPPPRNPFKGELV